MKIWKNLKRRFSRTTKKNSSAYLSLDDFPLYNWEKCQKGELNFVNADCKPTEKDGEQWIDLYNQYLAMFGLGEELEKWLNIKIHLTELRLQFVQSGDKMLLNYIKIAEQDMNKLDPTRIEGMTINQCLVHLNKWMGQWINKKQITIVEFKHLMTEYGSGK